MKTIVSNMGKGIYQFELTITDQEGELAKDTMNITVGELPVNPTEIIFKDLIWDSDWYNTVSIENFIRLIPPGSVFKIFIQRDNSGEWQEVPAFSFDSNTSTSYDYSVSAEFGYLVISYYGNDASDTPSVKIIF